jgi:anti-sigma B factor antagonist
MHINLMNTSSDVLQVIETTDEHILVKILASRLDMKNNLSLRDITNEDRGYDGQSVILDMEAVEYLDSSTIGTFLTLERKLRELAANLVLLKTMHKIHELLRITGIADKFVSVGSMDEAIEAISQG